MRLVYKFRYKDLDGKLTMLAKHSKNLYNQANYIVIQEFEQNGKWLRVGQLDKIMKETLNLEGDINYRLLKAQVSQQTLKLLDRNWLSFFRAIKDWKKHPSKYKGQPKPPKFLKNDKYILIYPNQSSTIKDNVLTLGKDFKIKIPPYKDFSKFQQVRILPKDDMLFDIEIVYEQAVENVDLDYGKYASIDLGLNNLVTLLYEEQALLISGRSLKSYNQLYNKKRAKLQAIKDKMGSKKSTRRLRRLEQSRNDYIRDFMHKVSRYIVNILVKNGVGTLAVGYNATWKDSIALGKRTNQAFVSISHLRLVQYLQYKCELCGIDFVQLTEEYTSKCDSLALEPIKKHETYKGKRIKRGMFQSSRGQLINADVNGALNIMRKAVNDSYASRIIDRGFLFRPVKIRNMFSNSLRKEVFNE